jgi:ubiquinone/menaquinone biosynthesis C-methylase UbiE
MSSGPQTKIFLQGEGDSWYDRNKGALAAQTSFHEIDVLCRTLAAFRQEIHSILEIGCGNGAKLNQLCEFFEAEGKGIDPGAHAVADGNRSFGGNGRIQLSVSSADTLPFADKQFDLVYFGFCLYLVDRDDLFRAIAEADRTLKRGGFLAITDFDPPTRHKRAYHHKEGVLTYKQAYADLLTASGCYHLVSKHSFSHQSEHFTRDGNERLSVTIMHKELEPY